MRSLLLLLLACLSYALLSSAVNHQIMVGPGGTLTFSPNQLQINAGDTVTFNKSNGGLHNVHEKNNAFFCSINCATPGTNTCNGNCNPTTTFWAQTITFPNNGTFIFQCDEHAPEGMNGTLVVGSGKAATSTTNNPTTTSSAVAALRPFFSYLW